MRAWSVRCGFCSSLGAGNDIAVAISISQSATAQARAYVATHLPGVGRLVSFALPGGPGQPSVAGGAHAAVLAEHVSNHLREITAYDPDAVVHIFAACPNSFLFFSRSASTGHSPLRRL
ncbi:SAVED domain-containing protein [Bosea sp. OAE752]|uniref:SAVED domain-containing protein n=1 Tax=Bosea sp. OAE752 TaxID=2663873 RepID=UPI003D1B77E9